MLRDALDGVTCLRNPGICNDAVNFISVVPKAEIPLTASISNFSEVDDCIEIRRPISNSSQILETLTAWMNLFLSKTTEIRGIHVLLVIISLILGKLCLDFSLLRKHYMKKSSQ
jgi:hypothetical protein